MFLGTYAVRLDEKYRLLTPARFRADFLAGMVMTKGQERCIYLFAVEEFARLTDRLRAAPLTAKGSRDYSRVFFASAHDEVPDTQGRVTISPSLREYASIQRECFVIGANTRAELWARDAWEAYLAATEAVFSALAGDGPP